MEAPRTRSTSQRKSSAPPALPIIVPNITNIVCGANLNCRFDLYFIALSCRNTYYRPKRFPACVLRIKSPKATGLVFATGKIQVLGTKSVDDAKLACRKFARMLQKIGFQPRMEDFKVQNIVGNADTKMTIRLEGICVKHNRFASYEPEIFPALIYTLLEPKMRALIFANGKVVLMGAKEPGDLKTAMELLYPVLAEFRR